MSALDTYKSFLQSIGEEAGLGQLKPDEDGNCLLLVGEAEVMIQFNAGTANVVLLSALAEIPEERLASAALQMLHGNLFWAETAGATLALDPLANLATLSWQGPISSLTRVDFEQRLNSFVEACEKWQVLLQAPAPSASAASFGAAASDLASSATAVRI